MEMNINTVGTINNTENGNIVSTNNTRTYNGSITNYTEEGNINQTITNDNRKNYTGPVIDEDTNEITVSLNDMLNNSFKKKTTTTNKKVDNIFAISYRGNKASFATNMKDTNSTVHIGDNGLEAPLRILYCIMKVAEQNIKKDKKHHTIILWGTLNDFADNKHIYTSSEYKAMADEIIRIKKNLSRYITFKKGQGSTFNKDEYDVKDKAWRALDNK